jgi:hypothetical protein
VSILGTSQRALLVSDGSEDKAMEGEPPRIVTRKIKT